MVTTGPAATHRIACHNPPTRGRGRGGRPTRAGHVAGPGAGGRGRTSSRRSPPSRTACAPDGPPVTAQPGVPGRHVRRWWCARRADLLEVRDLKVWFPITEGLIRAPRRRRAGGGRGLVQPAARRDAGPRRRVGLRQEHDRAGDRPAVQAHRRLDHLRRAGHHRGRGRGPAQAPAPVPDDLPGPVRLARPADDGGRHDRRAAGRPRRGHEGRAPRAGPRAALDRRAQPRLRRPLSARVLRRPAAAHRRRPGAGPGPGPDRRRRADLGARRLDPGPGHQPPRAAPGPARADVPVHRPRPVGRAPHQRPDRRDVPGPDRGAGPVAGAQRAAAAPVLRGAAVRGPDPGPQGRAPPPADHPARRRALAGEPAVRLPLPHPVLAARAAGQPGALLGRGPRAARALDRPRGRLPLRGGRRRVARAGPVDRARGAGHGVRRRVGPGTAAVVSRSGA